MKCVLFRVEPHTLVLLAFQSDSQQHSFNFTYQVGSHEGDAPELADEYSLQLAEGDVVVAATDGATASAPSAAVPACVGLLPHAAHAGGWTC
jgi:hypothetical protein